jgi:hypothetical protein
MSETNAPASLITSAGTILFNTPTTAPYYFHTDVAGLDQVPLRAPMDAKPHASGAIIHKFLRDARHITLSGLVVATSTAERNNMCDALISALQSIEQADGTYTWTPTGQTLKTLTVRCDVAVTFSGSNGPILKTYTFGLVAADPDIR